MNRTRLLAMGLVLVAVAALSLMPMLPAAGVSKAEQLATSKALPQISISLTDKGIVVGTSQPLRAVYYRLTIKNKTSEPRGIEMLGTDKIGSATVRYTKVLKPGNSEAFSWYFAKGTTVYVRDVLSWKHVKTNCVNVTFGPMRKAIQVK